VKVGEGLAVVETLPEALEVGRARSMMPTTSAATAISPTTARATAMRALDAGLLGGAEGGGVHCAGGGGWGFITQSRLMAHAAMSLQGGACLQSVTDSNRVGH
jgi:hypothetical protein